MLATVVLDILCLDSLPQLLLLSMPVVVEESPSLQTVIQIVELEYMGAQTDLLEQAMR